LIKAYRLAHWENTVPAALLLILVAAMWAEAASLSRPEPSNDSTTVVIPPVRTTAAVAAPEQAKVSVEVPETAYVCDLIELDASASHAESFAWSIAGVKDGNYAIT